MGRNGSTVQCDRKVQESYEMSVFAIYTYRKEIEEGKEIKKKETKKKKTKKKRALAEEL
jgi:hypothetical protein